MERASKSSRGERNPDRLSSLPDGVICHILSFLTTHESVETSVLAKRWRLLWAHVPVLDLHDGDSTKTTSFSGIVCTVLLRHKSQTLKTFRLTGGGGGDDDDENTMGSYELATCIATVVDRNVQNLYLGHLTVEVPQCLLTCKTLVHLTMHSHVSIPPSSGPVSLPSLKKLDYTSYKHWMDLARLLSGCPVLEDLTVRGYPLSSCNISSPTLKRLRVTYLIGGFEIQTTDPYLVKITAPALSYLKVHDCSDKRISVLPPASLVEAHISLKTCVGSDDMCPRRLIVSATSSAFPYWLMMPRFLTSLQFPHSQVVGPFVRFGNLTKLSLNSDWCLLTKFLQSADQLQHLVFHGVHHYDWESWTEPLVQRCACLLHSLQKVTIYDSRCAVQDFNIVKFILRNARVLKRMEIHYHPYNLQKKFDALQQIALVRRGSTECELVFD